MAQLVVAAAGAALGGFIAPGIVAFGMTGASLGWMAGSMIGSAFAPTQKSSGPQLSDLSVSTSAYGTPIPYVQGHPRIAGQIVWASPKREIATTTEQGKGGGGAEYTSYTYEVDLLILLTDNEIAGVSRVWKNGEMVYSILADADTATIAASATSSEWARLTPYTGASSQLPDPDYEAAVGTANAPAYRGRGSVFIKSLQLGSSGQIPNLTFEVYTAGTMGGPGVVLLCKGAGAVSTTMVDESPYAATATGSTSIVSGTGRYDGLGYTLTNNNSSRTFSGAQYVPSILGFTIEFWVRPNTFASNVTHGIFLFSCGTDYLFINMNGPPSNGNRIFGVDTAAFGNQFFDFPAGYTQNQWMHVAIVGAPAAGAGHLVTVYRNGVAVVTVSMATMPSGLMQSSASIRVGEPTSASTYSVDIDDLRYSNGVRRYTANFTPPTEPLTNDLAALVTLGNATLQSTVSSLTQKTGLSASQFDATALAAITRPVRSMAISSVSSARTVLEMLASSYHFEAVLSDKIYFRPRATAPAATLTFDELGVIVDSGTSPEPLPLTQANELEIPAQMALTYSNVDGDYQTDTQYSDRLLTGQESTSAMQVPLGFTSSEAKQIVDAMLLDKAVSALTTSISLGLTRAALEPTDVVLLTGEDGSSYRMRIVKKAEASGVTTLECVQDDSTVFTQTGTTAGGTASQTTVLTTPTTTLELLDVPLLRDVDNLPGHYVAVKGSAANWTSAGLYESQDNLTFTLNTTISSQAVIGTCSTTLGAWADGNVFDEVSSVTVNVGTQQLSSVTRDDILASQTTNAALIGIEVLQYRTATLVSAGVYTLSGFLRGQRGTVSSGHAASERFIVLASGGLRFVPLQQGDLGRLRYYKAASAGQRLSAVTSQSLTPAGVTLKPFAPVDARANRDTADTVLTWIRQTRLSTRIVGTLGISSPLGETAESYEVEIYTAGHAALLRTLTSATPSVTYTSAQQVTDFGAGQSAIAVKIYQISATVGRGTPLTTTV